MSPSPWSILSPIGRLLIGGLFLMAGPAKLAAPAATASYMASGGLPASVALAVAVGLFEIAGGLALAAGYRTRWTALALAAFTFLASLLFHRYWSLPADQQFVQQLLFSKNLAVVGALLFIAAVGAGAWSWDGRQVRTTGRGKSPALHA
jgi:putative oxidoreductase